MRIRVNLASRPFVELRPFFLRLRIIMGALAVVAIGLLIWMHFLNKKLAVARAQMDQLQAATQRAQNEKAANERQMRQPENAAVLARAHFLNTLFLKKSFSWTAVMMDLETVLPSGVQITAIEPQISADGEVTIRLRVGGDRDRAIQLVRNLERSKRFLQPQLTTESPAAKDTGQQGAHSSIAVRPVVSSSKSSRAITRCLQTRPSRHPNPTNPISRRQAGPISPLPRSHPSGFKTPQFRTETFLAKTAAASNAEASHGERSHAMSTAAIIPPSNGSSAPLSARVRSQLTATNLHFAGVALLAVLVLYLLIHMIFVWQALSARDDDAMNQQRIQMTAAQIAAKPLRGLDQKLVKSTADADAFYAMRLPYGYSEVAAELGVLTKKTNVHLGQVHYTQAAVPGVSALTEVRMDAIISGDYRPVVQFINAVERDKQFFVITGINLSGQQTGQVNLRMRLTTYLRDPNAAEMKIESALPEAACDRRVLRPRPRARLRRATVQAGRSQAMKSGTDSRKKTIIAGSLGAVALGCVIYFSLHAVWRVERQHAPPPQACRCGQAEHGCRNQRCQARADRRSRRRDSRRRCAEACQHFVEPRSHAG